MRPITVKFCVQATPIQTPMLSLHLAPIRGSFREETAVRRRSEQRRKFRNQPTAILEITTPTFGAQDSLSLSLLQFASQRQAASLAACREPDAFHTRAL